MEQRKKTTKRICSEQGAEERNRALETNKKFKCIKKSEHISRIFCFVLFRCFLKFYGVYFVGGFFRFVLYFILLPGSIFAINVTFPTTETSRINHGIIAN